MIPCIIVGPGHPIDPQHHRVELQVLPLERYWNHVWLGLSIHIQKKRRGKERSPVVLDNVLAGDRGDIEYESALDAQQQERCSNQAPKFAKLGWGVDATGLPPWPPPDTSKVEQSWRLVMLSQLYALMLERAGSVTYFALRVMKAISGAALASAGITTGPLGTM
ncbi:hypothetical protein FIBSPDRAFT_904951 [Athelia psychrophila]|uniref:Uncharacterized protein n=1 Tax=Athelia psychrophila TaxID=1759441 RepID=A0A167U2J1_9AGAM|nr:hypothetical protein FIBSPDRAFT_904951 [Fibularhizoctonia sp. CBS 109695]